MSFQEKKLFLCDQRHYNKTKEQCLSSLWAQLCTDEISAIPQWIYFRRASFGVIFKISQIWMIFTDYADLFIDDGLYRQELGYP